MKNVKIELIDENKIKVILSCLEILNLDGDITELFGETTSHKLLTRILNEAFFEHKFMAKGEKIMIESFPTPKIGYTVIITKFEDERKKEKTVIYGFSSYKSLKKGIIRIENLFFGSSVVYELDGKYYLLMKFLANSEFEKTQNALADFGTKESNEYFLEGILLEYGKILFEKDAIKMIKNHTKD